MRCRLDTDAKTSLLAQKAERRRRLITAALLDVAIDSLLD